VAEVRWTDGSEDLAYAVSAPSASFCLRRSAEASQPGRSPPGSWLLALGSWLCQLLDAISCVQPFLAWMVTYPPLSACRAMSSTRRPLEQRFSGNMYGPSCVLPRP
jgi:hypothetical protein